MLKSGTKEFNAARQMRIKLSSKTYMITSVNRKTKAAGLKDLQPGDTFTIETYLNQHRHGGVNSRNEYFITNSNGEQGCHYGDNMVEYLTAYEFMEEI